jgi:hypothetical protein
LKNQGCGVENGEVKLIGYSTGGGKGMGATRSNTQHSNLSGSTYDHTDAVDKLIKILIQAQGL